MVKMENIKNMLMPKNLPQLVLAIVSILYILGDIRPSDKMSKLVTTTGGGVVLLASIATLSCYANPVVTVIYLIALYELYERSTKHYIPGTESKLPKDKRMPHLNPENQFPVTLEEKVVKKMIPLVHHPINTTPSYKPVLNSTLNAYEL